MDIIFSSILALVIFFSIFSSISKNKQHHKKNLPPTPPSSRPVLGHLHLLKKPLHRSLAALSDRYGPVISLRFGSRPALLISSPSAAEDCLSKNDIVFANRPRLLIGKHFGYNYSAIGWTSYGPHWRNLRRIATVEILSSHRIQMLSAVRIHEVCSLLKSLFRDSEAGKSVVELHSRFSELAFNTMLGMIAGKRYFGEKIACFKEAKRFKDIVKEWMVLSEASNIGDFVPVLGWFDFGGVEKRMVRLVKGRDEFLQGLIDEHRNRRKKVDDVSHEEEQEGKKKKTMIEVLLSLQETEPEYYTDQIIKGLIAALLAAGTDTSSLTTEWAMSLLLNHPDVLEKAKAEMNFYVGSRLIDESDLPSLPYLQCIINETLRLYPVAPLFLPHESSEETVIRGFDVPRGTMLLANVWAIHRDPKVWVDPNDFKPERFQGKEVGKAGFKFLPFGHGRRACPGKSLAMKVVGLTLGALIQCFEWKRIGEDYVDMSEGPGISMPKAQPLEAFYKPRPTMVSLLSQL